MHCIECIYYTNTVREQKKTNDVIAVIFDAITDFVHASTYIKPVMHNDIALFDQYFSMIIYCRTYLEFETYVMSLNDMLILFRFSNPLRYNCKYIRFYSA